MLLPLTFLSGITWTIVYIDSIRVGFKRKCATRKRVLWTGQPAATGTGSLCSLRVDNFGLR